MQLRGDWVWHLGVGTAAEDCLPRSCGPIAPFQVPDFPEDPTCGGLCHLRCTEAKLELCSWLVDSAAEQNCELNPIQPNYFLGFKMCWLIFQRIVYNDIKFSARIVYLKVMIVLMVFKAHGACNNI